MEAKSQLWLNRHWHRCPPGGNIWANIEGPTSSNKLKVDGQSAAIIDISQPRQAGGDETFANSESHQGIVWAARTRSPWRLKTYNYHMGAQYAVFKAGTDEPSLTRCT